VPKAKIASRFSSAHGFAQFPWVSRDAVGESTRIGQGAHFCARLRRTRHLLKTSTGTSSTDLDPPFSFKRRGRIC